MDLLESLKLWPQYIFIFSAFTDKVEVHVAHIQNGLTHGGNVHAFNNNIANKIATM